MAPTPSRDATLFRTQDLAKPKQQIVIELRRTPGRYAPGSGPRPQPVTLAPANDSTAYIVDRILLASPGPAQDGRPLPRRMTYIVGWHDLPAARVLVPAMKILDYVSPWALEEWEYNFELELDDERAKLLEDKEKEQLEKALQAQYGVPEKKKRKKKRGRPPTHKHTDIEAGAMALPETDEESSRTRMKAGSMSLTTPLKTRMADFVDISDEEGSPSRQIHAAPGDDALMLEDEEGEIDSMNELAADTTSFNTSLVGSGAMNGPRMTQVPLPPLPRFSTNLEQRRLPKMFTSLSKPPIPLVPSIPGGFSSTASSAATSKSTTPVPLPPKPIPSLRPSQSLPPTSTTISRLPSFQTLNSQADGKRPASSSSIQTPVPIPSFTHHLPYNHQPASSAGTPSLAGKASSKTPRPTSSNSQNPSKPPRKRRRKTKPLLDEDGQPVWIVKRIEGDAIFEIENQGPKRLYKVRWEGDWPPEENPTWEPAENLPENLVRNWHKAGLKIRSRLSRGLSGSTPKEKDGGKMKQMRLEWNGGQKFTSVSDAFEAGVEKAQQNDLADDGIDMILGTNGRDIPMEDAAEEEEEELFIVDKSMEQNPLEISASQRSALAARVSSWSALFGGRSG